MAASNILDLELPIGRELRGKLVPDLPSSVRGGSFEGLSFDIFWDEANPRSAIGWLKLQIGETAVFDNDAGMRLDLAKFLDFMATKWDFLSLEQGFPYGATPDRPSGLWPAIRKFNEADFDEAFDDALVEAFVRNHNLLSWCDKEDIDPLWIVRDGNLASLEIRNTIVRWPYFDVMRSLVQLGDAISLRLKVGGVREDVQMRWRGRERAKGVDALKLSLSLSEPQILMLIDRQIVSRSVTRVELMRDMDEVRAAARMLGSHGDIDDISNVVNVIKDIPKYQTSLLDDLSQDATLTLAAANIKQPHDQGRLLARWLRKKLDMYSEGINVSLDELLNSWEVACHSVTVTERIEAISVWGPQHGPAIILNSEGIRSRRSGNQGGTRATLAHEICHLLVDRGVSLSVIEVLGGATPLVLEQRANAFAAEFLLPREWAISNYRRSASADDALKSLMSIYGVSKTLAAAQLLSYERLHPGSLEEADRDYFRRLQKNWR